MGHRARVVKAYPPGLEAPVDVVIGWRLVLGLRSATSLGASSVQWRECLAGHCQFTGA